MSSTKSFLDTSIFIQMFKSDQKFFEGKIKQYADGRKFAAYFTAIELNRGFLQTLVSHYREIEETHDVPAAIIKLSNEFGRIPKYANILEAYMLRFSQGVSNDYRIYNPALEGIIFDMNDRANCLVKRFVGHFQDHALAALNLYGSEDYEAFLEKCRSSSELDLIDFWTTNHTQLYKIRDKILDKAPVLTKPQLQLLLFIEEALGGRITMKYPHLSDLAIALECPKDHNMIAYDHSFDLFIPLQGKSGGFVPIA